MIKRCTHTCLYCNNDFLWNSLPLHTQPHHPANQIFTARMKYLHWKWALSAKVTLYWPIVLYMKLQHCRCEIYQHKVVLPLTLPCKNNSGFTWILQNLLQTSISQQACSNHSTWPLNALRLNPFSIERHVHALNSCTTSIFKFRHPFNLPTTTTSILPCERGDST